MAYTLELEDGEVEVVVEGLRLLRENWHDGLMKILAGEPAAGVGLDQATDVVRRCDAVLKRLPRRGLTT